MKGKKGVILGAVLLAALLVVAGVAYTALQGQAGAPGLGGVSAATGQSAPVSGPASGPAGQPLVAPNFTVYNAAGDEVQLEDFLGQPVVLNFWASWCPPCKDEMPAFERAYTELGEEVHFLMVDMTDGSRETQALGQAYIDEQGYTFPVYFDTEMDAAITYGVRSIPTTVFINSAGQVVAAQQGALTEEMLRQGIALSRQ